MQNPLFFGALWLADPTFRVSETLTLFCERQRAGKLVLHNNLPIERHFYQFLHTTVVEDVFLRSLWFEGHVECERLGGRSCIDLEESMKWSNKSIKICKDQIKKNDHQTKIATLNADDLTVCELRWERKVNGISIMQPFFYHETLVLFSYMGQSGNPPFQVN